ncbi:MAG: NAD(P)H-dependent oxidoreductase subunit E [bacterium]
MTVYNGGGLPSGEASLIENYTYEQTQHRQAAIEIAARYSGSSDLISILLDMQEELGWLSREGMLEVARLLGMSETTIFGVATFYNRFRFTPPGKRRVQVCMGTACHVKRGGVILDLWKRRLCICEGETTADREFSLEQVACVGCCALAPVTVINKEVIGGMTTAKVDGIMLQRELEREREEKSGAGIKTEEQDAAENK